MKHIDELWKKLRHVELIQVHPAEIDAVYKHCFEFKSPSIVEIGSAHGASSLILADAAEELGGDLHCIDNFVEEYYDQEKFGDYARQAFYRNVFDRSERPVTLYDMDSAMAVKELIKRGTRIDVLFIDGAHDYDGVKRDCALYLPLLVSGGYVAFHDYNNVGFSGVKKAADEATDSWAKTDDVWDLIIRRKP